VDIRAQVASVFHLDKCIGCHTCSLACKNLWTDRKGTEYMWWNNVETKPGTGYPTLWEDQAKYRGGWEVDGQNLRLRSTGKLRGLTNIFFQPYLPTIDDYYEPWTYRYQDLFDAPAGDDQPTARPISQITGAPIEIEAGPNWDDDLGGSPVYAANDPNLASLSEEEKAQLFQLQQMTFFYIPRICNHCLNPACVAACPSGALYKRGEDGIVLVNQDKCRGWRYCVSACPYKKVYYNWATGKSEKCILCFPRQETGYAPACFHSCVGRIRYLGVLLYDADLMLSAATAPDLELVDRQVEMIVDPFSPAVIEGARRNGIPDPWIAHAQQSPVYKLVKEWRLALPLHAEHRTLPMLFYVPPLLPAAAKVDARGYRVEADEIFGTLTNARLPIRYMASLFGAGNETVVERSMAKMLAVRVHKRAQAVHDYDDARVAAVLKAAGCTPAEAEEIYQLTATPTAGQRHLVPPFQRELEIEETVDPHVRRAETGFGPRNRPRREF
jgi:nitrate reductase beta subunit